RQRLAPAIVFSTNTRMPDRILLSHWSARVRDLPFGFFWLEGQDTLWFIALKSGVLAQSGSGWVDNGLLIGQLLVMLFAWLCRAEIDHLVSVSIDQQQVFIGVGLFLAAVSGLLCLLIGGTLPPPFCAINQHIGSHVAH